MTSENTRLTVSMAVRAGAQLLGDAGIETAAVEAKALMGYALASEPKLGDPRVPVSSTDLFMRADEPDPEQYQQWLRRRIDREPMQHIVGSASFDGLDFLSSPAGFIPRPETELLVEWADHWLRGFEHPVTVVDVCSGPGTIALALAHRLSSLSTPPVIIIGIEKDPAAIQLARDNEAQLRRRGLLADSVVVKFLRMDVREPVMLGRHGLVATADLVLSNPPYVPETALDEGHISVEVRQDPHDAVFGGADGMSLMPDLARFIDLLARVGAGVAVEHDDATGPQVQKVLREAGMVEVAQHHDFADRDRFVTATIRRDPGHIPTYDPWAQRNDRVNTATTDREGA